MNLFLFLRHFFPLIFFSLFPQWLLFAISHHSFVLFFVCVIVLVPHCLVVPFIFTTFYRIFPALSLFAQAFSNSAVPTTIFPFILNEFTIQWMSCIFLLIHKTQRIHWKKMPSNLYRKQNKTVYIYEMIAALYRCNCIWKIFIFCQ